MRRAAKVDANQPAIVKALRAIGATVKPTHMVGKGFPDLVVGFRGLTKLLEIKTHGEKPNKDQEDFISEWRGGQVLVVRSPEEAISAVTGIST